MENPTSQYVREIRLAADRLASDYGPSEYRFRVVFIGSVAGLYALVAAPGHPMYPQYTYWIRCPDRPFLQWLCDSANAHMDLRAHIESAE